MAMPGEKRLRNLALAQIALGVVAGVTAPIELPDLLGLAPMIPPFGLGRILIVPLFASAMTQALLLAVWGVASTSSPWTRLAGLAAGTAYLEGLLAVCLDGELLGTATVTIVVTTTSLLLARAMGLRFSRRADPGQPARPGAEGLRFSIRDLMVLVAAVALLSAGARALEAHHGRFLLLAAVWALCFVSVGLAALWAMLGDARPQRRAPLVLALSPVLGVFFAYAAAAHRAGWVYILLTMLLYPALLLGSLLVVRSCGYRLARRAVSSSEPPAGELRREGQADQAASGGPD
jgi:hypothetical protein